jgi:NitT/TauT family transport system substrate-binding protein
MKRAFLFLRVVGAVTLVLTVTLTACGRAPSSVSNDKAVTMRVGYFPNITHSQALIGFARGDFEKALGPDVTLDVKIFNAGPSVIEAMFARQLDVAYIGPNPAINGYVQSNGEALRIVAGATSAGAAFVVRPAAGIHSPEDLAGKALATPQLGNTQDVALRAYLAAHGLKPVENGGNVRVIPTANPQILDLFRQGQIDGAWVPEPWASRLVVEGGGELFLDERELWPGGDFVTAHIIVNTAFLEAHPDLVKAFLSAHVAITQWELEQPDEAKQIANSEIARITGQALSAEVLDGAWTRMSVTYDPISSSLVKSADDAYTAGFLKTKPDLSGIYDLSLLNQVLTERGLSPVQ